MRQANRYLLPILLPQRSCIVPTMPVKDEQGRPLLTLQEAARHARVSAVTLRKAALDGRLMATRLSSSPRSPWITTLEDVQTYLRNQSTNAQNARIGWEKRRARQRRDHRPGDSSA